MADNSHMYNEIKKALQKQIDDHLTSLGEKVDVYRVPYQNIPIFPAVTLELESRRKPKKGVGVKELNLVLAVWVYVEIYNAEDAEEECLRITELVEDAIESDKTLGGTAHYLSIDEQADFGTVDNGNANFLQGAKINLEVKKRFR